MVDKEESEVFPGPTRISAAPEPLETPTAVCTHIDARCKCIFCHPLACVKCARAMYAKGHRKSAAAVSDFERALLPDRGSGTSPPQPVVPLGPSWVRGSTRRRGPGPGILAGRRRAASLPRHRRDGSACRMAKRAHRQEGPAPRSTPQLMICRRRRSPAQEREERRGGSASAGRESSPRRPHRRRLLSSGPRHFAGFRARGTPWRRTRRRVPEPRSPAHGERRARSAASCAGSKANSSPGSDNLLDILKRKWWKYVLLGLADVEANYLIVRAYQYTTLTSVQLLDCFGIPVLMALSWFILRARYRVVHFIAVFVCLLGVGTMVGADIVAGREDNSGSDVLIGDVLVLLGASLYAVSNVCEEYIVKKLSRQEFLGMVGLFGTVISGIQLLIVEYEDIASIHWDWRVALLFVAFALCMFCLYSFMPLVIKVTSATSVNLGILTADLYSLFFGLFLFGYK
uniref:Solute carrier family 35 member F2 n=1 Tax=Castor canadensis TaxID=51338 RepID=A0A8B7TT35_CASCN